MVTEGLQPYAKRDLTALELSEYLSCGFYRCRQHKHPNISFIALHDVRTRHLDRVSLLIPCDPQQPSNFTQFPPGAIEPSSHVFKLSLSLQRHQTQPPSFFLRCADHWILLATLIGTGSSCLCSGPPQ